MSRTRAEIPEQAERERFTIELRAEPAEDGEPPVDIRLRRLLKVALREFRFKAIEVGDTGGDAPKLRNE